MCPIPIRWGPTFLRHPVYNIYSLHINFLIDVFLLIQLDAHRNITLEIRVFKFLSYNYIIQFCLIFIQSLFHTSKCLKNDFRYFDLGDVQ